MIRLLAVCLVLVLFSAKAVAQKEIVVKQLPEICLSPTEIELYKLINDQDKC